jgi:hypothetical protein
MAVKAARVCVHLLLAHEFFMLVAVEAVLTLLAAEELLLCQRVAVVVRVDAIAPVLRELQTQAVAEVERAATLHNPAVRAALESSSFVTPHLYYHPLPQQEALR